MAASVGDSKGYDHQFTDTSDDLLCLICKCMARDPQQINCCGKLLCNGCLKKYKKHSSKCPQCRKEPITSFVDKRSERDILSLKTRCDNTTNGCEWVEELRSLDEHLASCGFTLLPCPNECSKDDKVVELLRKDLEKHTKEECPRRQYECPHCQEAGEYQERTTEHLKECPMKEIPCPNDGCQTHTARCNLSKHRQECAFEKVSCKYSENIGCKEEVLRKDLRKHEEDSQKHLQLSIDTVCQHQDTIRKQQHTIMEQEIKLLAIERKLAHLQSREMPKKYKFTHYDQHKTANEVVYSPPFYTSPGGYLMCICVLANGDTKNKGTHVSVSAYCVKGENDDHLSWPFTGKVTVELLNQLENKNHHSTSIDIKFSQDDRVSHVANEETLRGGLGTPRYISHSALNYNAAKKCQYLRNDSLYFRISVVDAKSSSKPWLV